MEIGAAVEIEAVGEIGIVVRIEVVGEIGIVVRIEVVARIEVVVKIEDVVGMEDVVEIEVVTDVECVNIRCPKTDFESHCDAYYSMHCLQSRSSLGQQVMARGVGRLA